MRAQWFWPVPPCAGNPYNLTQFFEASTRPLLHGREVCLLVLTLRGAIGVRYCGGLYPMFLIRLGFWLGLAVLLLPTDERQQARLYGSVVAAVDRATTFCDRNAQVCTGGAELWSTFLRKAEFGARMVVDLASSGGRKSEAAEPVAQPTGARSKPEAKTNPPLRGTLTPSDLSPAWRGYVQRTGS
jgi:hypothetical protein